MIGLLRSLRSAGAQRREFLAACQDFDDPALRRRLVDAVEQAIDNATHDQLDTDRDEDGIEHASVWWRWNGRHLSAQRTIHPDRRDHAIYVDGLHFWSDPSAGPWMATLDETQIRFRPGCGFNTPETFLDWFERGDER
jgi:hypothetical protein